MIMPLDAPHRAVGNVRRGWGGRTVGLVVAQGASGGDRPVVAQGCVGAVGAVVERPALPPGASPPGVLVRCRCRYRCRAVSGSPPGVAQLAIIGPRAHPCIAEAAETTDRDERANRFNIPILPHSRYHDRPLRICNSTARSTMKIGFVRDGVAWPSFLLATARARFLAYSSRPDVTGDKPRTSIVNLAT